MDLTQLTEQVVTLGVLTSKKVELEHKKFQIEAKNLDLESRSSIEKQTMSLYITNSEYTQVVDKLSETEIQLSELKVLVPYLLRIAELESIVEDI